MAFMDAFNDTQRALFESSAHLLHIKRGEYLLRRGEPGGDLFLLREGRLEAVDTRATPEVILAVMAPGKVVGEMSFLDGSPRSMDVRVSEDATVLRWAHRDLRALLRREPVFAAAFYESVAQLASLRMRRLTKSAISGALVASEGEVGGAGVRARMDGERVAQAVKSALMQCDTLLRESDDVATAGALEDALFDLQESLNGLLVSWPDSEHRALFSEVLQRELHPYLVRSTLADRCIRRPQGVTATPEILAQVLVDQAVGEGRLGEIVDRWLLDRPTLMALRELSAMLPVAIGKLLPTHRNRRILVLSVGTGSLVARLSALTNLAPTHITVVDSSSVALQLLDTDVAPVTSNVTILAIQHDLVEFSVGRVRVDIPPVDVIVLHGLVEYLPDRLVVSLLRLCRSLLNDEGHVVTATLSESADAPLFDRLLRWPSLRRSPQTLVRLHVAAGLPVIQAEEIAAPAVMMTSRQVAQEGTSR